MSNILDTIQQFLNFCKQITTIPGGKLAFDVVKFEKINNLSNLLLKKSFVYLMALI